MLARLCALLEVYNKKGRGLVSEGVLTNISYEPSRLTLCSYCVAMSIGHAIGTYLLVFSPGLINNSLVQQSSITMCK